MRQFSHSRNTFYIRSRHEAGAAGHDRVAHNHDDGATTDCRWETVAEWPVELRGAVLGVRVRVGTRASQLSISPLVQARRLYTFILCGIETI